MRRCLALLGLLFLGAGLAVSRWRGGVACFPGLVVAMAALCFPNLVGFATDVPPFPPFLRSSSWRSSVSLLGDPVFRA